MLADADLGCRNGRTPRSSSVINAAADKRVESASIGSLNLPRHIQQLCPRCVHYVIEVSDEHWLSPTPILVAGTGETRSSSVVKYTTGQTG